MSGRKYTLILAGIFCGVFVCTIILSSKIVSLWGLAFPASIILFPLTFLVGDVLTEIYGYRVTRQVVLTGLASEIIWIFGYWLAEALPSAPFWANQDAFARVLGATPRIALAGMTAYVVGEFLNSYVLAKMKVYSAGKHMGFRLIGSTVVGAGADTVVVLTIAFAGVYSVVDLVRMRLSVWALKVAWEIVALPVSIPFIRWLKRVENEDYYDVDTNFSPFALNGSASDPRDSIRAGSISSREESR